MSFKQFIGSRHDSFSDFKISSFNVDRDNLPFIPRFNLLPNTGFVECLPTVSQFFFAVTTLADCHKLTQACNMILSILTDWIPI